MTHRAQRHRRPPRGGWLLVELAGAAVLVAGTAVVLVHLLALAGAGRRDAESRAHALLAASNLLEQMTARPWDEVQPYEAAGDDLPPSLREALPAARITVAVQPWPSPAPAKQLTVEVRWGPDPHALRLTTWTYQGDPAP